MGTWKEILMRTGIILLAAVVVFGLSLPLTRSDWADGLRSGADGERLPAMEQGTVETGESEGGEPAAIQEDGEPEGLPNGAMSVLPFVKILVLMGIPGLIACAMLWLTRRSRRFRQQTQLATAPSIRLTGWFGRYHTDFHSI